MEERRWPNMLPIKPGTYTFPTDDPGIVIRGQFQKQFATPEALKDPLEKRDPRVDLLPELISADPGDVLSCYSCGRLQEQMILFSWQHYCFDCAQTHGNKLQKRGRALERKIRRQQEKQSKAREE